MYDTRRTVRLAIEWAVVGWFFGACGWGVYLLVTSGPSVERAIDGGLFIAAGVGVFVISALLKVYGAPWTGRNTGVKGRKNKKSRRGRGRA